MKVGSGILTDDGKRAHAPRSASSRARSRSWSTPAGEVVVVSSGAIAVGSRTLGWSHPGRSIPEKQAAAAVGQIGLVELYRRRFARYGLEVGAGPADARGPRGARALPERAPHAARRCCELGVVPIVNENDTVATEEIRFGDNDNLSATVVNLVGADLLVILTDVDGLYREPPRAGEPRRRSSTWSSTIGPAVARAAGGSERAFGRGGMITKLEAARAAARCGAVHRAVQRAPQGRAAARRRGRAGRHAVPAPATASRAASTGSPSPTRTRGALAASTTARCARSSSAAGACCRPASRAIRGEFGIGDPVACVDARGVEIARGLAAYSSEAIERIAGLPTQRIDSVLGYSNGDEVIHRDDLVLSARRAETNA